MHYVYVLQSEVNQRFYTGSTGNLDKRICEHNFGQSKYTRLTKPFKLVYSERFETRPEAVRREMYFKTGKGREELKRILGNPTDSERGRSSVG